MLTNPFSGFFLDIEGIDGAGQTTQVTRVAERLKKEGYKVGITRAASEATPVGKFIRQALNHKIKVSLTSLEFLFAADHKERQDKEIVPVLEKGGIVISDRSVWSFIAYGALEMDRDWLFNLTEHLIFPDLAIFLKVSPRVAMERIVAYRVARDFFEKEKVLARVWENYQWLAQKFSDKIRVIDGERKIDEVTEEIVGIVRKHPKFRSETNLKFQIENLNYA